MPRIEDWEGKRVLVIPILEFRAHVATTLSLILGGKVDVVEITNRGWPTAHITKPIVRPQQPPPETEKLPVGEFTFNSKEK